MPARRLLMAVAILGFPIAGDLFAADTPSRPNVLLIMVDDLGAECLSSYGCLEYNTPRLAALATSGVRFTHAHSQPLCTPSRVQIMTGQYNFRNYDDFGYLDPNETTFGDYFRRAGYQTAVAGKWQLSGQTKEHPKQTDPDDWGFDEYCLWQMNNRAPYGNRGPRYWNPYLERNGEVIRPGKGTYGPDICAAFLMDFISRHQDKPFFVYYPMILTHSPFLPTPNSDPARPRDKKKERNFGDMVEYMDKLVGQLLDHLDALGLSKNTLVIFVGDNGTSGRVTTTTKQGKLRGGKGTTTPAGTHVPLIVRWPGRIEPGTVDNRLIDFTDILPSLLAATGINKSRIDSSIDSSHHAPRDESPRDEPPRDKTPSDPILDGIPFLAATGLAPQKRNAIYCWYEPRHSKGAARNNAVFARNHEYKLYADGRFFKLTSDFGRSNEKPLKAPLPAKARAARQTLQKVLDKYGATVK